LAKKFIEQVIDKAENIDNKEMKKIIEGDYQVEIKRQFQKKI